MKNFFDRKIPTLIGLLIIIAGTAITTFLVKRETLFQIVAGPEQEPENIKITNISDSLFTLTYTTDAKVIGTLNYSKDPTLLDTVSLDDRDQISQSVIKYSAHSITVKDLEPNTLYYFSITSGDKKYLNNASPFKVETGEIIDKDPSLQVPMSGKIVMPNGNPASDGLVYVKVSGAQELSTLINIDGTFTIPLNNLRNSTFDDLFTIDANTIINIEIYSENLFSSVSVSPEEINPVPLITLSNNYDFSSPQDIPTSIPQSSESGTFPSFGSVSGNSGEPKILTPGNDEEITDSRPTFEGTAQPNATIEIEIQSNENIQTQVTADSTGKWTYTPPDELSEGEHTITVTAKNKNGVLKTITQSFVVFAAAGEISPTPSPMLSPTNIPSISPAVTVQISPSPLIPPTGNSSIVIATIVGIAAAFSGIVLFFLTRGKSSI